MQDPSIYLHTKKNNEQPQAACDWNFILLIYEVEIQDENNVQSHTLSIQIVLLISLNKLIKYGSFTCNFTVGSLDISCRIFLVRDQCSTNFLACLFLPSLQKKSELLNVRNTRPHRGLDPMLDCRTPLPVILTVIFDIRFQFLP